MTASTAGRLTRAASLAILIAGLAACSEQRSTAPRARAARSVPGFNVMATEPGRVYVCPEGPTGTPAYAYAISATVETNYTVGPYSGTFGSSDVAAAEANQTIVANPTFAPGSCTLVFQINGSIDYALPDGSTIDPLRDVTIQQIDAPDGTQQDSIVTTYANDADVKTIGPATTVTVGLNDFHGSVAAFWSSLAPVNPPCPAGSFSYTYDLNGNLQIKYDQFPAPNDNSYGTNAIGWTKGHKFNDLVGSDHAGFQLVDGGGTVRLSFNVDYISAVSSAPSGYASLGVTGGDGKMLVGTADGISATTSLANNLNNINIPGLFNAAHVQQFGSVNLLINSPPTDPQHLTYNISDPTLTGWDFHDTYYVTVSAAKLASIGFDPSTWKVMPNASQLHNSPAKACPTTAGTADLAVTNVLVKDKQVQVTIMNSGTADALLSALTLNWPTTNGKLMQVKLDADIVYDNPDIAGGTANLGSGQLVADQNKRKITKGQSDVLTFVFEKIANTTLANYASTATFGTTTLTALP